MSNEIIQVDYEALEAIASRFATHGEAVEEVRKNLRTKMDRLTQSWQGRGSDAFFAEMDRDLMPAIGRLASALHEANRTVKQISEVLQTGEGEASGLFKSKGDLARPGSVGGTFTWRTGAA